MIALAVVLVALTLRRFGSNDESEVFTDSSDDEAVEESPQSVSSSGGLLARAERLK